MLLARDLMPHQTLQELLSRFHLLNKKDASKKLKSHFTEIYKLLKEEKLSRSQPKNTSKHCLPKKTDLISQLVWSILIKIKSLMISWRRSLRLSRRTHKILMRKLSRNICLLLTSFSSQFKKLNLVGLSNILPIT